MIVTVAAAWWSVAVAQEAPQQGDAAEPTEQAAEPTEQAAEPAGGDAAPAAIPFDATTPAPFDATQAPSAEVSARQAWSRLPSTLSYRDGDPVPAMYELRTRRRAGLMWAGVGMLAAPYVAGMPVAVTDTAFYDGRLWPMFIPVGGPVAAAANFGTPPGSTVLLVMDTMVQAGGLAMIIAGGASRVTRLERIPFERLSVGVAPTAGGGHTIVVGGSF